MIIILHVNKVRVSERFLIVMLIKRCMRFGRSRKVWLNGRGWEEGGK